MSRVQVYRLYGNMFTVGKSYYYVLADCMTGNYPGTRYFADKSNLEYVGEFVETWSEGQSGDGCRGYYKFNLNGVTRVIETDYDGRTCFLEKE